MSNKIFQVNFVAEVLLSAVVVVLSLQATTAQAQCPAGDVTLETQTQVDSFGWIYPGCTEMLGELRITDEYPAPTDPILDISPLADIQRAKLLHISGTRDLPYVGLDDLQFAEELIIAGNSDLVTIDLPALAEVQGEFRVGFSNYRLRELHCPTLRRADEVSVIDNGVLMQIDLTALEEATYLGITANDALLSIDLPVLTRVDRGGFEYNDYLQAINLPSLQTVDYSFIFYETSLEDLDLPSLSHVGNVLHIGHNPLLQEVRLTPSISVNGKLRVIFNEQLSKCCSFMPLLAREPWNFDLRYNAFGCSSVEELQQSCSTVSPRNIQDVPIGGGALSLLLLLLAAAGIWAMRR